MLIDEEKFSDIWMKIICMVEQLANICTIVDLNG